MNYKEDNWAEQVSSSQESVKEGGSWKGEDFNSEAEESPLLETVTRERQLRIRSWLEKT
jgi:hypothetical protein